MIFGITSLIVGNISSQLDQDFVTPQTGFQFTSSLIRQKRQIWYSISNFLLFRFLNEEMFIVLRELIVLMSKDFEGNKWKLIPVLEYLHTLSNDQIALKTLLDSFFSTFPSRKPKVKINHSLFLIKYALLDGLNRDTSPNDYDYFEKNVYGLDINNEPLFLLVNLRARFLQMKSPEEDPNLYDDIIGFVYKGIDLRFWKLLIHYLKRFGRTHEAFEKLENLRFAQEGTDIHYFKKAWYILSLRFNHEDAMSAQNLEKYVKNYIYDPFYIHKVLKKTIQSSIEDEGFKKKILLAFVEAKLMSGSSILTKQFSKTELREALLQTLGGKEVLKKYISLWEKKVITASIRCFRGHLSPTVVLQEIDFLLSVPETVNLKKLDILRSKIIKLL